MSYCLGIKVGSGLIFASDTRTNAGVDSVSTFRKLFVFDEPGERVIVALTAGNLAVTQEVINTIDRCLAFDDPERNIMMAESMFDVARVFGNCLRTVFDRDADYFKAHGNDFIASLIVGGQIRGERHRLFMLYAIGNFIELSDETPYFQLGETKYGKPILERALTPQLDVTAAAKCALISFDSTIQANISVGLPIDMVVYAADSYRIETRQRIEQNDPYFLALRQHWSDGLRSVFAAAPDPHWKPAAH